MTTGEHASVLQGALETSGAPRSEEPGSQLLERNRAHGMNLDMSFAAEGEALLGQLDEGIYGTRATADYFLPDATDRERKLFYNIMLTSDRTVPLRNGDFFVKRTAEVYGMPTHERAEAIVDRIAELIQDTPGQYLDEIIERIRKEGQLLKGTEHELAEAVSRRSLRLIMRTEKIAPNTPGPMQVDAVLEQAPALPATVGEAIDRMAAVTKPGTLNTGTRWMKHIRGRFLYEPSTIHAIYRVIDLDPRFIMTRHADSPPTSTYSYGQAEGRPLPLATKADIYQTSSRELAEIALGFCATWDLRPKIDFPTFLAQGKQMTEQTTKRILRAVLEHPAVQVIEDTRYVRVLHTPEDARKYDELARIADAAITALLKSGTRLISHKELTAHVLATAHKHEVELTKHVRHMLRGFVEIDPRISWSRHAQKLVIDADKKPIKTTAPVPFALPSAMPQKKTSGAKTRVTSASATKPRLPKACPVKPVQTPSSPQLPEVPSEEVLAAQAAVRSLELMRRLGQERVAEIHAAVDHAITRYIDEASTTIFMDKLLGWIVPRLTAANTDGLSPEEHEYLLGVVTHHERFEPIEDEAGPKGQPDNDPPRLLRIRHDSGQPRVVLGEAHNPERVRKLYLGE